MSLVINTLTVDCRDPKALADFWTAALGWPVIAESEEGVMIAPFEDRHPGVYPLWFQVNPDRKSVKNRWHLDLAPDDQAAEVARLEALGRATPTSARATFHGSSWPTSRATSSAS